MMEPEHKSPYATDEELREAGFLALHKALGAADAVRFIRLFRPGPGDYTEERTLYIGDPTLDEIMQQVTAHPHEAGARDEAASADEPRRLSA